MNPPAVIVVSPLVAAPATLVAYALAAWAVVSLARRRRHRGPRDHQP